MYYEVLADRVHYFKEDEKGVAVMCKAMEDMRNEAAKMKAVHIARLMLDGGKLSYEDIAAANKKSQSVASCFCFCLRISAGL